VWGRDTVRPRRLLQGLQQHRKGTPSLCALDQGAARDERDAAVTVNGARVEDDYVLRPGDEIEFQKQAGVKGLAA
jgi:hypothetical protein